jgi:hypothetical protein
MSSVPRHGGGSENRLAVHEVSVSEVDEVGEAVAEVTKAEATVDGGSRQVKPRNSLISVRRALPHRQQPRGGASGFAKGSGSGDVGGGVAADWWAAR